MNQAARVGEKSPLINCKWRSPSRNVISTDDILNFIGFGPFQVVTFLLCGLTNFASACDISVFVFIGTKIIDKWNITTTEYSLLPASTAVPNVAGALFFGYLSDHYGRIWPYALCVGWVGFFSAASAFANRFYVLVILRCTASIAIGGIFGFSYPTLIEFLPVRSRGSISVLNMLMSVLGLVLNCGLAWWLIPTYSDNGWRYYIVASSIPLIFIAMFRLVFYFESPRYLIANEKFDKAWRIFNSMAKINGKKLSDFVPMEEFNSCTLNVSQIPLTNKPRSYLFQFFMIFHPKYLRRTIPLTFIMISHSLGFLTSQLFLPNFLKGVGFGPYFILLVTSLAQIPGIILLSIIVEWPEIGRINSLRLFSSLAMLFFLLLSIVQNAVTIPLFLIFIYFSTSPIMGLLYTYISEVYPTRIRTVTVGYFYILQALTYMAGSLISGEVASLSKHWIFPAFFSGVYFVLLCMSLVLNYEPRGKKLQDLMN